MPIENARPVIQMDIEGNFITEFPSIKAAAKTLGGKSVYTSGIHSACNILRRVKLKVVKDTRGRKRVITKSNIAYGFRWAYKETT